MRRLSRTAAFLSLGVLASTTLAGCVTEPVSAAAADRQICLHHHENSPEEQARCRVDPGLRGDSPPDMMPQQLPIRTKGPGD